MSRPVFYILTCLLLGSLVGASFYTFYYAKGWSYLSNDPKVCMNCHIMQDQYHSWVKSPHHAVAVCNDCHTPHDFLGKYKTKAENGFWHSFYFTTQTFKEPIQITPKSKKIVENNCKRCHEDITAAIQGIHTGQDAMSCVRCHNDVGH